jgi:hypothetical protein
VLKINVEVDMSKVRDEIANAEKQVRFATAVALTRTGYRVYNAEGAGVKQAFDRPTPSTQRAFQVEKATRDNLTATVSIKQRSAGLPADEYLHAGIVGGKRGMKRSEIMLQAAGILPQGMQTVPGKAAKLDAYGNMSRGQINQILSYFATFGITTLNSGRMNMTAEKRTKVAKNRAYFVIPVSDRKTKLYPGIWQQDGRRDIKPVLMFVKPGVYKAIFAFEDIGAKEVQAAFNDEFDTAMENAMRTAR